MSSTDADAAPEIICRQQFFLDSSKGATRAVPELLILANKAGYQWLAEYFNWRAGKPIGSALAGFGDRDDHQHLQSNAEPFNARLSDELEIRTGLLTGENREQVLANYGIEEATRQSGCLTGRYQQQIDEARRWIERS